MPAMTNVDEFVKTKQLRADQHLLILEDERCGVCCYGTFVAEHYSLASMDAIEQLFSQTQYVLFNSSVEEFSYGDLPILSHIGLWKIVILTVNREGRVSMRDGSGESVTSHLGVGG